MQIVALAILTQAASVPGQALAAEHESGSTAQTALMVERFAARFGTVGPQMADDMDSLYAADLRFRDPITQLEGRDAMRRYLRHFAERAPGARFTITDTVIQAGNAAVFWTMLAANDSAAEDAIHGVSHLRVSDRVYEERDYFDLDQVYEQVPVVNWFTRLVKSRLRP
jgi:steroid Delta-isomerase